MLHKGSHENGCPVQIPDHNALSVHGIWKDNNYFNKRSLDVHICHLRNYLNQDSRIKIDTIRGLGYSLAIQE